MIEWLLGEQNEPTPLHLPQLLAGDKIMVPSHWPIEVANVLRTQMRFRNITPVDLSEILERLDQLNVTIEPPISSDEIGPRAIFSHTHDLTSYDGSYVQLAFQRRMTLATLDKAMGSASSRLNIPLLPL
jgi:predicted nucleic acid-binding protein